MSNPFKQNKDFKQKPKRATFDLSHFRHGTYNFGGLYPVFCQKVMPGDTFRIKMDAGLEFMPTIFPVLNQIKGYVHFFYCRNRNLYEDFPDFIFENKPGLVEPYLKPMDSSNVDLYKTGGLLDHLGLPTTIFRDVDLRSQSIFSFYPSSSGVNPYVWNSVPSRASDSCFSDWNNEKIVSAIDNLFPATINMSEPGFISIPSGVPGFAYRVPTSSGTSSPVCSVPDGADFDSSYAVRWPLFLSGTSSPTWIQEIYDNSPVIRLTIPAKFFNHNPALPLKYVPALFFSSDPKDPSATQILAFCNSVSRLARFVNDSVTIEIPFKEIIDNFSTPSEVVSDYKQITLFLFIDGSPYVSPSGNYSDFASAFQITWSSSTPSLSEYADGGAPIEYGRDQLISALPVRAYESIYNAFYRDARNNPYELDGEFEYNKYLPTLAGGLDTSDYKLHYRNWHLDAYTSAVQSPQQGVAPLVGITSLGDVTFKSENGKEYTFSTETAEDSDTIIGVNMRSSGESEIPNDVNRSILNVVSQGISINDFRNVNAYQRFKETNIRRGLKLRDQTLARWGVNIAYSTLDMPEFIGGISIDITPSKINQTTETPDVPLGGYAGQLSGFKSSSNSVYCNCDEHGFIIGIMSIVPQPVYDMLLPHELRHMEALDYFNPEFDRIGMQAIKYREISPLLVQNRSQLDSTFGYQRPWHEYLYACDTAHGQFRLQLRNYLLSRQFKSAPVLSPDFLLVNPNTLNNVFSIEGTDKILGVLKFDVKAKRPISSISIPSL